MTPRGAPHIATRYTAGLQTRFTGYYQTSIESEDIIMRATLLILVICLPASVAAQTFTPVEQSLINAIEECWRRANDDMSMQALQDACGSTEATTYWWTPETAPLRHLSPWVEGIRAAWNLKLVSQDLRPIRIHVDEAFGFIYFYAIRIWESASGERETESWRGFEVWKQVEGGWAFVGGTGTPDSLNQVE